MNIDKKYAQEPIFFERNRVYRVYKGGKGFHTFFGDEDIDGNLPEEWMASTVKALNKVVYTDHDGLSVLRGTDILYRDLLETYPDEILGEGGNFDVLVKMLDSAIRLPIQAHPDKPFSRKYFGSDFGKTECWIITAVRENAKLYFGFKEDMTREEFEKYVTMSDEDKDCMTSILHEINPKVGDVYLIPALCVHAIGYGCLLLEVQEPTDFTIQPERWCGDYRLSDYEMYLGLDKEVALDCFDYSVCGDEAEKLTRRLPRTVLENDSVKIETLIGEEDTPCFGAKKYTVHTSYTLDSAPSLYVVMSGDAVIEGDGYSKDIRQGDYFVLPHSAIGKYTVTTSSEVQLIECIPPKK
ncbi:MAG: class I mannose-6-phosphate isomerase [Clostridia bacterium]|nr:class I mannose-6-phosphate isomerase [Clostridia bacterium]